MDSEGKLIVVKKINRHEQQFFLSRPSESAAPVLLFGPFTTSTFEDGFYGLERTKYAATNDFSKMKYINLLYFHLQT